jgi:PilZ domain
MSQPENGRNRRASRRRAPKGSTRTYCYRGVMGLGTNLALSAVEVSETGACLLVKEPFDKNEEVEVQLEGMVNRRPIRKMARVVWCVTAGPERWRIGLQFQGSLCYTDLSDLTRT